MNKQAEYDRAWRARNRSRRNYLSKRSTARHFIRLHATLDDLDELEYLLKKRRIELVNTYPNKECLH